MDCNIVNDSDVAFVRMNTAYGCNGTPNDKEKYKLVIGKCQSDELIAKYDQIRDIAQERHHSIITFCLAHHLTMYLFPDEANRVNRMLLAKD